jgi:hypothetical protein
VHELKRAIAELEAFGFHNFKIGVSQKKGKESWFCIILSPNHTRAGKGRGADPFQAVKAALRKKPKEAQ